MPKIDIAKIPLDSRTNYPSPYDRVVFGRERKRLGNAAGLDQFGVNLTTLKPGAASSLRHCHEMEDEFVYILEGRPTLLTDAGRTPLAPGDSAGFKAGTGDSHCLINETETDVVYLEIGDRSAGDVVVYPEDDLKAVMVDGKWRYAHKDGTPY